MNENAGAVTISQLLTAAASQHGVSDAVVKEGG